MRSCHLTLRFLRLKLVCQSTKFLLVCWSHSLWRNLEYACLLCLLCSYQFPKSKFHEDQNSRYTSSTQNNKQHLRGTLHYWGNEWMKPCDQDKHLIKRQRTGFLVQKTHFPNRKVLELSRRKRKETQKRTQLRSPCVTFLVDRAGCQKHFVWGVGACPCHSQAVWIKLLASCARQAFPGVVSGVFLRWVCHWGIKDSGMKSQAVVPEHSSI